MKYAQQAVKFLGSPANHTVSHLRLKKPGSLPFPIIGDPHHEIRQQCKERGWLDVFHNEDYGHLRARVWASHPKGYYQPAVLTLHKTGQILYRWRCVPKFSNMSGAGARPEAIYTWDKIKDGMQQTGDAAIDQNPVMGLKTSLGFGFCLS